MKAIDVESIKKVKLLLLLCFIMFLSAKMASIFQNFPIILEKNLTVKGRIAVEVTVKPTSIKPRETKVTIIKIA